MGCGCGKVGSLMRTEGKGPPTTMPTGQDGSDCEDLAIGVLGGAKPSCTHHLTQERAKWGPQDRGSFLCCLLFPRAKHSA